MQKLLYKTVSLSRLLIYNFHRTYPLDTSAPFEFFYIFHLREKRVKQKLISMCSNPKFVSRLFLKNVKKTNCIENICFYGVLQKTYFLLQFHRHIKIYDFISFTMTRSRASQTSFSNFWKINI